jgi:hypothetical protein
MKRVALVVAILAWAAPSFAGPDVPTCIAAFDEGQRARSSRTLKTARDKLIVCTQETCPAVLRADCAGVLKEVEAALPSVVFAVDDGQGHDVVDVKVFDGDVLLIERLDGAALKIDPGLHRFRLERAGARAKVIDHVANEGERGRVVRVSLAAEEPAKPIEPKPDPLFVAPSPTPSRSTVGYAVPIGFATLAVASFAVSGVARLGFDNRVDEMRAPDGCAPRCTQSERSDLSDRLVTSNIALGIGIGSLVVAGVSWLLLSPPPRSSTSSVGRTW